MFSLTPQEQKIILFILVIVLVGAGVQWYFNGRVVQETPKPLVVPNPAFGPAISTVPSISTTTTIVVHIDGAVKKPGVYNLPRGSRIFHAIQIAGDTVGNADITNINYAEPVQDGEKIEIPFLPVTTGTNTVTTTSSDPPNVSRAYLNSALPAQSNNSFTHRPPIITSRKININTASIQELDILPGIGPALAQRIIEYRQVHGGFRSLEQIKDVKGIGVKKFEVMKNMITL